MEAEASAGRKSEGDRSDHGQYDPTKLINWGTNRWSFKPEFGYSQRWDSKWILDAYLGVWFFTTNQDFWSRNIYFAGTRSQSQAPIGALEGHLSYDFQAAALGFCRRQFLVRRENSTERPA